MLRNDNRLFLLILATQPITVDVARAAPLFGASENAVTMRMFKLRQKAKELLEELEASSDESSPEESSESEVGSPVTVGPQRRSKATLEKDEDDHTTVVVPWKPMAFETSLSLNEPKKPQGVAHHPANS
ncbi:MAG: hypothetical protein M1816_002497 [Peltula sp. TS41687]|nr:MAG: hypothetical protein M1816_002497 [Peltula sp. TS41687]